MTSFELRLHVLFAAALAAGCGGSVDEGRSDSGTDGATDLADTAGDAVDSMMDVPMDTLTDSVSDVALDTCPPCGCGFDGRLSGTVAMDGKFCAADGGPPDTCKIDCTAACTGVAVRGSLLGITQIWGAGGTGGDSCSRVSATEVVCEKFLPCGRTTAGQTRLKSRKTGAVLSTTEQVDSWLLQAAYLEAGSVAAFERLADELECLPTLHEEEADCSPRIRERLIEQLRTSAEEERRHRDFSFQVCRKRGLLPSAPESVAFTARHVVQLAIENAVEGCVRETYGALVALHQSRYALDPDVRSLAAFVVEDEMRHAAVSHTLATFLEGLLTQEERAQVEAARIAARCELSISEDSVASPVARQLGLPVNRMAQHLIAGLVA